MAPPLFVNFNSCQLVFVHESPHMDPSSGARKIFESSGGEFEIRYGEAPSGLFSINQNQCDCVLRFLNHVFKLAFLLKVR
jgi:hypothetical protein